MNTMDSTTAYSSVFLKIVDRVLIYDVLFPYCSPATILRISRTCRLARLAVLDYSYRAYDIDRLLSRFFRNVTAFRCLQARTGAVVSGSLALQFFDRSHYPDSDCDLYVPYKDAEEIGKWILSAGSAGGNCRFEPRKRQAKTFERAVGDMLSGEWDIPEESDRGDDEDEEDERPYKAIHITDVFTFVSDEEEDLAKNGSTVQMIVTKESPMDAIMNFHSTVVMNAITHKAAYSFFPRATFEERKNAICRDHSHEDNKSQLAKYRERGWDDSDSLRRYPYAPDRSFRSLFYYHKTRWAGDKYCWTIPFDTSDVVVDDTSAKYLTLGQKAHDFKTISVNDFDPIKFNGWTLSWSESDGKWYFSLLSEEPFARYFKYNYFVPEECMRSVNRLIKCIDDIYRELGTKFPSHENNHLDFELSKVLGLLHLCTCPVPFIRATGYHDDIAILRHIRKDCRIVHRIRELYREWPQRPKGPYELF